MKIKFFAGLREYTGMRETELKLNAPLTVAEVWIQVCGGLPRPENTLIAVNMNYVTADAAVTDGDEVAFFPPVTGG